MILAETCVNQRVNGTCVENRRFAQFAQNYAVSVSDFVRNFSRFKSGTFAEDSRAQHLHRKRPCNACKNCHYCNRCAKQGGMCGDEPSGWPMFAHEVKVAVRLNDHFNPSLNATVTSTGSVALNQARRGPPRATMLSCHRPERC